MLREPQKDWTLDDMVVAAVTSRGTRVRVFRKASGLPPMAWLSAVTGYGEAEAIGNLDFGRRDRGGRRLQIGSGVEQSLPAAFRRQARRHPPALNRARGPEKKRCTNRQIRFGPRLSPMSDERQPGS